MLTRFPTSAAALIVAASFCFGQTITLQTTGGRIWSVDISAGQPRQILSRAALLAAIQRWAIDHGRQLPNWLYRDGARSELIREARDSTTSKLATIGAVALPACSTGVGLAAGRIIHGSIAAQASTLAVSLACGIWGAIHGRVQADVPDATDDIGKLLPDAGAVLDDQGSWSGLLVARSKWKGALTAQFEVSR